MSFLRTLSLMRCSNVLLNPATSCPIFRLPSFQSPLRHQDAKWKITDFAKKTGDYMSLSAVDIQVLALTYQLEKEHIGADHLHSVPHIERVAQFSEQLPSANLCMAGFYIPSTKGSRMYYEVKKFSHGAPEETEEEADHKKFQLFDKTVLNQQVVPEDTEDTGMHVRMTHNRIHIAPGGTEDDAFYQCGKKIQNKFAPEDVEEDAWHKPNPQNIILALTGPDEISHVQMTHDRIHIAPGDTEDNAFYQCGKKIQNKFAPEDVEEDAWHKSNSQNIIPTLKGPDEVRQLQMTRNRIHVAPGDTEDDEFYQCGKKIQNKFAPEDEEGDAWHKSNPQNIIFAMKGPDEIRHVQMTHDGTHIAPGDTEDDAFYQCGKMIQNKFAPEDVEEDAWHKSNPQNILIALKGPDEIREKSNSAPEDMEEEAIRRGRSSELQHLKFPFCTPQDVEQNVLHKLISKYFLSRKAPEDVEEEAIHEPFSAEGLIALKNAPEEVEEETKHKSICSYSKLNSVSQNVNLVPEETEDAFFKQVNTLNVLYSGNKQKKQLMESAPEDEEDGMHKLACLPLVNIGYQKHSAPEDVEEEAAYAPALRPQLIMNSSNQLGQRVKSAPEEVDEEEMSSFHTKWNLPTGKKFLQAVFADETDKALHRAHPVGVKYFAHYIAKDIMTASVGRMWLCGSAQMVAVEPQTIHRAL